MITTKPGESAVQDCETDQRPGVADGVSDGALLAAEPMRELAQGTRPDIEPAPVEDSSAPIEAQASAADFSEAELAFFAVGDQLEREGGAKAVEEFVDLADRELSFWQRFWRR